MSILNRNWRILRKILRHYHVILSIARILTSMSSACTISLSAIWHHIIINKLIDIYLTHYRSVWILNLINSRCKIMRRNELSIDLDPFIFVFNHHSILFSPLRSYSIVLSILRLHHSVLSLNHLSWSKSWFIVIV